MKSSKKVAIIVVIVVGLFGYSQYASASQIRVIIVDSKILSEDERGSIQSLQLEFDNPSLLTLTAGETEFVIHSDDKKIGDGTLETFILPALGKALVDGTFQTNSENESESDAPVVKISGVTTYDILFTSIDVPFVYYPTEDQARKFIHQNWFYKIVLTVFGSTALDTIRTPSRTLKNVLGGAATFAGISASFFVNTGLIAVVGSDFPKKYYNLLGKYLDLRGLAIKKGKTFRYDGSYDETLSTRQTLKTELNVLGSFKPTVPEEYRKSQFVYLANNDPDQNVSLIKEFDKIQG